MNTGEIGMVEFFVTFLFFLLIIIVMAVGVMRGRDPISGTCGGLNQIGEGGGCELCGGDPAACRELDPMAEPLPRSKSLLLSTRRRALFRDRDRAERSGRVFERADLANLFTWIPRC